MIKIIIKLVFFNIIFVILSCSRSNYNINKIKDIDDYISKNEYTICALIDPGCPACNKDNDDNIYSILFNRYQSNDILLVTSKKSKEFKIWLVENKIDNRNIYYSESEDVNINKLYRGLRNKIILVDRKGEIKLAKSEYQSIDDFIIQLKEIKANEYNNYEVKSINSQLSIGDIIPNKYINGKEDQDGLTIIAPLTLNKKNTAYLNDLQRAYTIIDLVNKLHENNQPYINFLTVSTKTTIKNFLLNNDEFTKSNIINDYEKHFRGLVSNKTILVENNKVIEFISDDNYSTRLKNMLIKYNKEINNDIFNDNIKVRIFSLGKDRIKIEEDTYLIVLSEYCPSCEEIIENIEKHVKELPIYNDKWYICINSNESNKMNPFYFKKNYIYKDKTVFCISEGCMKTPSLQIIDNNSIVMEVVIDNNKQKDVENIKYEIKEVNHLKKIYLNNDYLFQPLYMPLSTSIIKFNENNLLYRTYRETGKYTIINGIKYRDIKNENRYILYNDNQINIIPLKEDKSKNIHNKYWNSVCIKENNIYYTEYKNNKIKEVLKYSIEDKNIVNVPIEDSELLNPCNIYIPDKEKNNFYILAKNSDNYKDYNIYKYNLNNNKIIYKHAVNKEMINKYFAASSDIFYIFDDSNNSIISISFKENKTKTKSRDINNLIPSDKNRYRIFDMASCDGKLYYFANGFVPCNIIENIPFDTPVLYIFNEKLEILKSMLITPAGINECEIENKISVSCKNVSYSLDSLERDKKGIYFHPIAINISNNKLFMFSSQGNIWYYDLQ